MSIEKEKRWAVKWPLSSNLVPILLLGVFVTGISISKETNYSSQSWHLFKSKVKISLYIEARLTTTLFGRKTWLFVRRIHSDFDSKSPRLWIPGVCADIKEFMIWHFLPLSAGESFAGPVDRRLLAKDISDVVKKLWLSCPNENNLSRSLWTDSENRQKENKENKQKARRKIRTRCKDFLCGLL